MTKKILFLLLISSIVLGSCQKEEHGNSSWCSNVSELAIEGASATEQRTGTPIAEIGDTISESEANSRINEWVTEYSTWESDGLLSLSNYLSLKGTSGAQGVGFSWTTDAVILAYPVDSEGQPIMSYLYELDSNGGTLKDTSDFGDLIDAFTDTSQNWPSSFVIGLNLLEDITGQSGTNGLIIYNSLDDVGDEEYNLDIIARSYNSSKEPFGTSGTVSERKGCRVWVPGHVEVHGHFTWWVDGHWEDCDWVGQITWLINQAN